MNSEPPQKELQVLITGASGFVGAELVQKLSGSGRYGVRILSRRYLEGVSSLVDQQVAAQPFDEAILETAVRGVDTIVHCAGRAHVMDEFGDGVLAAYRQVNVDYSLRLARAALKAGVRRIIYVSSIKVNGESTDRRAPFHPLDIPQPQDVYGQSKWEAEQALRETLGERCELVVVRPPLVYGPGVKGNLAKLQSAVLAGKPLPFGCLSNRRSLVSLFNLVDFLECCLIHPGAAGKVFIPSDPQDLSVREMVQALARVNDVRARLVPLPVWCLKLVGQVFGRGDTVRRLCGSLLVDHSHTAEWLGWTARHAPFDESTWCRPGAINGING